MEKCECPGRIRKERVKDQVRSELCLEKCYDVCDGRYRDPDYQKGAAEGARLPSWPAGSLG